ncbi:MAG: hypothetical protein JXR73_09360 [Candidatus Omnitrophica bacterium]|nr:hypothetical protein [Candidatus Omnitrophota bacterium]
MFSYKNKRVVINVLFVFAFLITPGCSSAFDSFERAKLHPIAANHACVDFFEGALLGNGGMGAVVTTRPDAVVIYFGHNNVWDIRVAEDNQEKIGTFQEIFEKVKAISEELPSLNDDPWYNQYRTMTRENYAKPYPRPFPCGSVLLGFDRREVRLLGHRLDVSNGLCEIALRVGGRPATLQVFADMTADRLWFQLIDEFGDLLPSCFERIRLFADPKTPEEFPRYTIPESLPDDALSFRQTLPALEPDEYDKEKGDPNDRAFHLSIRLNAKLERGERINWEGLPQAMEAMERALLPQEGLVGCIQLDEGLSADIDEGLGDVPKPTGWRFHEARRQSDEIWKAYWNRSGVALEDEFLERVWYWNLYFINCSVRDGVTCPGLFANWSLGDIGTAWHGDYHMNYNTQQPFWATFSSNHVEKNLPYVDLVDHLLPVSRKWAKDYYGLRGSYFPHSAYPTQMNMMPYPVPTWGWEICETPWTVQGLWWHYLYTMDESFLRERAFTPIREAVLFLVDYMKRPEARGERWGDDKYHIFPTVPPELYGLKPGFQYNYDCLVDLTLTKFIFKAYLQAVDVLNQDDAELVSDVNEILEHFPDYPTAESKRGAVFVSVPGERSDVVYNVPNSLMTVFPGEEHGLHSPAEIYDMLKVTYRNTRIEGGNELVFLNLQAARIGLLDLEEFKRQIRYCMLPNGSCTDMVLQVHGRYNDYTNYAFMERMGIWFENFALPVVINECLMQSYNGVIRLFPNWPEEKDARFYSLRAAGAFLVSAEYEGGAVQGIEIESEAGAPLRLINPWPQGARIVVGQREAIATGEIMEQKTEAGETIRITPFK